MAKMTREEYVARAESEEADDWAPGWDAIDDCLRPLYGDQKPAHLGTPLEKRAVLGGDQYIDGYSIYTSPKGYKHGVTYGMTELYVDVDAFGQEHSRWGYEMTMKYLTPDGVTDEQMAFWSAEFFASVGSWANKSQRLFESMQCLNVGNGKSFNHHVGDSAITAVLFVNDTELIGADTVHGRVDFLQFVGITDKERKTILDDPGKAAVLVGNMKADSPDLVTDFSRTTNYL
ncbi:hypothetical protein FQN51_006207 [Onygenales sp. PD_10]|nr:hypothetical protein FQN51_006207 [Onygenales sp. PD_10]